MCEQFEFGRRGKFRSIGSAAVEPDASEASVMRGEQCLDGLLDEREFEVGRGEYESSLHLLLESSGECGRVSECSLVVFGPQFVHGAKDSEESGRPIGLISGWEVGASGDGAGIGSEEH